jgi:hypothetical protein
LRLRGGCVRAQVDVWAFGITVYEMLHNALPWTSVAGLISTGTSNVDNKHIKVTAEDVALFSQFKVRYAL